MRVQLSERSVSAVPFVSSGQMIVRDAELNGFFLLIGKRTKTFMVQADLRQNAKRQSIRVKIGETGVTTVREARAAAKVLLGQISAGVDPRVKSSPTAAADSDRRSDPSLRAAWQNYRDSHMLRKGRSQKTVAGYEDHVLRLMKKWLDQPLSKLGHEPVLVKELHDRLTKKSGPYMANACMRTLRAIYNHARKYARVLPAENPVFAIDWNLEHRRDSGMGVKDLSGWFAQLAKIENPIRREMHLFMLLSGSRPEAIKTARIEHLDLRERLLFIPNPKGGARKAFAIPLSRQMVRCIVRAVRLGRMMHPVQAGEWLFPAASKSGHIIEHKESGKRLSHWGNELRQSYRTIGQSAGVGEVDMHLLMNHALPGVNAGYITREKLVGTHLRHAQQQISDKIWQHGAVGAASVWLAASSQVVIKN
jgi:integrase